MSLKSNLCLAMLGTCLISLQAVANLGSLRAGKSCGLTIRAQNLENEPALLELVELTRQKAVLLPGSALEKLVTQELDLKWKQFTQGMTSEQVGRIKQIVLDQLKRNKQESSIGRGETENLKPESRVFLRPELDNVKLDSPLQLQEPVIVAKYGWIQPNAQKSFSGDGLTRMVIEPKLSNGSWSEHKVSLDGPQISEGIASGRLNGKGNKHKINVITLKGTVGHIAPVFNGRHFAIMSHEGRGTQLTLIDPTTAQVMMKIEVSSQIISSIKIAEVQGQPDRLLIYGSEGVVYDRTLYAVVDASLKKTVFNGQFKAWGGEVRLDPYAVLDPQRFEILHFQKEKFIRYRSDGEPYIESARVHPNMEFIGYAKNMGEAYFIHEKTLMALSTENGELLRSMTLPFSLNRHFMDLLGGDFIHIFDQDHGNLVTYNAKDFKYLKSMQMAMDSSFKINSESQIYASYDNLRTKLYVGTLDVKQGFSLSTREQILNPKLAITTDRKNLLVEDVSGPAIVLKISK